MPEDEAEGLFLNLGWHRVMERPNYIGGATWHLLEKRLAP
jgi:hypothetical protein